MGYGLVQRKCESNLMTGWRALFSWFLIVLGFSIATLVFLL